MIDRRCFLGSASAAGIALLSKSSLAAEASADIRVGVIGVRGRGREHLQTLGKNVVAICDVDEEVLHARSSKLAENLGRAVSTFIDFRQLLEDSNIDAVTIATPNHTHSLIAIAAIQAGKDVYVEKPVSHNVWEGQQLVAAANQYERIVQCGTQSRSSSGISSAVEWVRSGELGKIRYVIGTCYKPRMSIGKLNTPLAIPSSVDYDLWCGPAEKRDLYRPQLHYDWHWDFNTGNGDMGNQGVHQMDIARWFLGEDHLPSRVVSIGGRFGYDDAGDTPNTQVAYFEYPEAPLIFETRGLPRCKEDQADWRHSMDRHRGSRVGVIVQCEKGYVLVPDYTQATAFDSQGRQLQHWQGTSDHFANWLTAVERRDKSLLHAEIAEGHLSSALCHVAMISHRVGETKTDSEVAEQIAGNDLLSQSVDRMFGHLRANDVLLSEKKSGLIMGRWLELEPHGNEVLGDTEATALLSRSGRKPFVVPQIT